MAGAAGLDPFGREEDELRNVGGDCLFGKYEIYNELVADRAAGNKNPAW